jgi:hypothetical protein
MNVTLTRTEYDDLVACKVKLNLIKDIAIGTKPSYIKDDMIAVICGIEKGEENGETEKVDS